jgi:hypothetical protein
MAAFEETYGFSSRCWIFDPKTKHWAREPAIEGIQNLARDEGRHMLTGGGRISGPTYGGVEYTWIQGKLVETAETTETLGETPDGKPLPSGFGYYVTRKERIRGVMKVVKDGPQKDP